MKCANCANAGFYIYQLTKSKQIFYCDKHLPRFLDKAKRAGLLQTTSALQQVIEEGLKKFAPQVEEPVVEEAETVEEIVAEEPIAPKPEKKATKKKAE